MQIPETQKKIQKTFFDLELIAFELIALNPRFYLQRILIIGCQYVNKQCPWLFWYSAFSDFK